MSETPNSAVYICPMHGDVREKRPGRCPTCGMNFVPQGARFKILRHCSAARHIVMLASWSPSWPPP